MFVCFPSGRQGGPLWGLRLDRTLSRLDIARGQSYELATAKAGVVHKGNRIVVQIEDFISPTIIERLEQQTAMPKPKIDDWRVTASVKRIYSWDEIMRRIDVQSCFSL